MDIFQVIKEPSITEKATLIKEGSNQICFKVSRKANKIEVRQAVEALFNAKVIHNLYHIIRAFDKVAFRKYDLRISVSASPTRRAPT